MKAQAFLELVEKMMTMQADYYAASKKFGSKSPEAIALIVKSKELEKQCRAVIKEGHLEPDEPTAPTFVTHYTTEEFQEKLRLINEEEIQKEFPALWDVNKDQGEQPT
jgi:hypothetical protein